MIHDELCRATGVSYILGFVPNFSGVFFKDNWDMTRRFINDFFDAQVKNNWSMTRDDVLSALIESIKKLVDKL